MLKIFTYTLLVFSITGCASIPDYIAPVNGNISRVVLEKSFDQAIPGSSTLVFKYTMSKPSGCFENRGIVDTNKFMTVTDSNPFIFEFNPDGTNVRSGELLILKLTSISGPTSCTSYIKFTPQKNEDYKVRLTGSFFTVPAQCNAELWSKLKNRGQYKQKKLRAYNACK